MMTGGDFSLVRSGSWKGDTPRQEEVEGRTRRNGRAGEARWTGAGLADWARRCGRSRRTVRGGADGAGTAERLSRGRGRGRSEEGEAGGTCGDGSGKMKKRPNLSVRTLKVCARHGSGMAGVALIAWGAGDTIRPLRRVGLRVRRRHSLCPCAWRWSRRGRRACSRTWRSA